MRDLRKSLCVNVCEGQSTDTLHAMVSIGETFGDLIERKDAAIADLVCALQTAIVQVEYMHRKFQETGSGNGYIAQWKHMIAQHDIPKDGYE